MRSPLFPALAAAVFLACAGAGAGGRGAMPEGERIYRTHCASCHRLRDPGEHTAARWAWALNEFGRRAHLAPEERAELLAWLQARAADAPRAAARAPSR